MPSWWRLRGAPVQTSPSLSSADLEVHHQVDRAARLKVEVEDERSVLEEARVGRCADPRGAPHTIAADQREPIGAGVRRWPLLLRHDSAQLEHGLEVRPEAQLERELYRLPVIAADRDPLAQRARAISRALQAQSQRLRRHPPAVAELEVRIRELVDGLGARGVGGREQSRQLPADAQLVRAQEATVPEPESEGVVDVHRQAAVAQRDQEDVAILDHDRVGQIGQRAEWAPHTEQHCPSHPRVHIGAREGAQ